MFDRFYHSWEHDSFSMEAKLLGGFDLGVQE